MHKLDVALKLFRLLNERKSIDSRLVADELDVSLRTAQRYLLDLSAQPCVFVDEKEHTYALNPEYPLKNALRRPPDPQPPGRDLHKEVKGAVSPNYVFCLTCGLARNCFPELSLMLHNSGVSKDARQKFNQLVSLIRRKLKEGKCSFPLR
jgi:hypothetical protein